MRNPRPPRLPRPPREAKPARPKGVRRDPAMYDEAFDRFWSAYPKRTPHANPKKLARDAFVRALKRGATPDDIIKAASIYADYCKVHSVKPVYVAMAATFLNQERYSDYLEMAEAPRPVTMEDVLNGLV